MRRERASALAALPLAWLQWRLLQGPGTLGDPQTFLTQRGSGFAASMLGDLEKGGAIEGRHVIGDMLGRARKFGVAAPNLRMAYAVVQAYEARRARDGLGKPTK